MPLGRWEAGIALASMGLCLPSQALGIMPAESRNSHSPTPSQPERTRRKGGTTSKLLLPQEGSPSSKPIVIATPTGSRGLARAERPLAL